MAAVAVGGPEAVGAEVELIEPTGSETHLNASLDGKSVVCVFRKRVDHNPGQSIRLSFASDAVHFFDPETELRITEDLSRETEKSNA